LERRDLKPSILFFSDGNGDAGRDRHLDLAAGSFRNSLTMFDQALHDHPDDFFDVFKCFFWSGPT
jgi:hypothetical protein